MLDFGGKLAMPKIEAVSHALPQFTLILFSFVAGKFLLANMILLGVIKILKDPLGSPRILVGKVYT